MKKEQPDCTALSHLRQQMPKIVAFALEVFPFGETTLILTQIY